MMMMMMMMMFVLGFDLINESFSEISLFVLIAKCFFKLTSEKFYSGFKSQIKSSLIAL